MSVYLALHTGASPSIAEIAEFGATALRLGAPEDTHLAVQRDSNGGLTVVLPIPARDPEPQPPVTPNPWASSSEPTP